MHAGAPGSIDAYLLILYLESFHYRYQYCRDVPKGTLRMILSRLANGQSGTLSSDQEDDIMRALTHNSVKL